MKTYSAIICIATFVVMVHGLTDTGKNRIATVHSECQSDPKTHIEEEVLRKFHDGETVDNIILGAHTLCMSTKLGLIIDGKVNRSNLKKGLAHVISDEAKLNETVEKCAVDKDTPEETAIALERCFLDSVPDAKHHHHQHH